jgi:hypothetical protein
VSDQDRKSSKKQNFTVSVSKKLCYNCDCAYCGQDPQAAFGPILSENPVPGAAAGLSGGRWAVNHKKEAI